MPPTALTPPPPAQTQSIASRNFTVNLQALSQTQPALIGLTRRPETEWSFLRARDASLTAISAEGRWLADCSLPRLAAAAMIKSLDLRGTAACLLAPTHAAHVRRSLDLLNPEQAVIVLAPDPEFLAFALHCEDFSPDIDAHRLFFAPGPTWPDTLADLFTQYPGLPTPVLFIRPPTTPDAISQSLIELSQPAFNRTNASRAATLSSLAPAPIRSRVCVMAPSIFRLWSDAGSILADTLGTQVSRFNPDRPTAASHLALAIAARDATAFITANLARADAPANLLPPTTPWITWVTTPAIPDGRTSAPNDRLILADPTWPKRTIEAGWDKRQLSVATWPTIPLPAVAPIPSIALIADTRPLRTDIDEDTFEFSSHMVLWELIASELHASPLAIDDDPAAYLNSRMARLSITPEGLDRPLFLDHLIQPAYHQGLARLLLAADIPLRLFGRGWDALPEFAPHAAGPILSRPDLHNAASSVHALLRPPATPHLHPIDALARPLIKPSPSLLRDIKSALASPARPPHPSAAPSLTPEFLTALLRDALQA